MFLTHGLPVSVQSDNGPPFASKEFEVFLEYLGKEHKKVVIESSEGYTEDAQCSTLEKTCQNRKARHWTPIHRAAGIRTRDLPLAPRPGTEYIMLLITNVVEYWSEYNNHQNSWLTWLFRCSYRFRFKPIRTFVYIVTTTNHITWIWCMCNALYKLEFFPKNLPLCVKTFSALTHWAQLGFQGILVKCGFYFFVTLGTRPVTCNSCSNVQSDPPSSLLATLKQFAKTRNHETAPKSKEEARDFINKSFQDFGLHVWSEKVVVQCSKVGLYGS